MIEINHVAFNYPGSSHHVYDDLTLNFQENCIYGLLGKNGMGKSTLLYLIAGLLRTKGGNIIVDGKDMKNRDPEALRDIFIVPEEYEMPNVSMKQLVSMHKMFYPNFSEDVLYKCLMDFEISRNVNLKELSMGQKKKVYMSVALASGTRYLLMDEPTNGLDIPSKSLFRKVIAQNMREDQTIIISTHQVHDVESMLDHIIVLDNGQILLDTSTVNITDHYCFSYRQPGELDGVVYKEPSLQGYITMSERKSGDEETQLNLELLFNALTRERITLKL